jgi:hypothetical protein
MPGTLSVATTVVLSAKVAVVNSGEVDRSAALMRYSSGPSTLHWGTPMFMGESSVYSYSILTRKYLLCM